jgi:repressor LexA
VVKQQSHANNGDIVVALIEDEATVKRFYREKDHIRLQPENSFMEPILVKDVSILGRVTGVFRRTLRERMSRSLFFKLPLFPCPPC